MGFWDGYRQRGNPTACPEMALAALSEYKDESLTVSFWSLSGLSRNMILIQPLHLNFDGKDVSKCCINCGIKAAITE